MADVLTPKLSLTLPDFDAPADERVLNQNFVILDDSVTNATFADALADALPAAAAAVLPASPGVNLLSNPGFEIWQRGPGPFTASSGYGPDRWIFGVATSTYSLTRLASTVGSQGYSARVVYTHAGAGTFNLYQRLEGYQQVAGKTVTFAATVKASVAGRVRAWIYDAVKPYVYGAYNVGTGEERVVVTAPLDTAAVDVTFGVEVGLGSCSVEINDAVMVVGPNPALYAPLNAAEDLGRCKRYYYELGGADVFEFVCPLQCHSPTLAVGVLRHPVEMAVPPTVTVVSPTLWGVFAANGAIVPATAVGAPYPNRRSLGLNVTVAGGLVAGNASMLFTNNSLVPRLVFEANV